MSLRNRGDPITSPAKLATTSRETNLGVVAAVRIRVDINYRAIKVWSIGGRKECGVRDVCTLTENNLVTDKVLGQCRGRCVCRGFDTICDDLMRKKSKE